MSTAHNNANREDVAKVVLMPGDPLRAKLIYVRRRMSRLGKVLRVASN